MQTLELLSANIHELLERYAALQEEYTRLRKESELQREELIRTHSELMALQQQNKRLATANAMTSAENSEEAQKRLTALIAQVDRAIAALKK